MKPKAIALAAGVIVVVAVVGAVMFAGLSPPFLNTGTNSSSSASSQVLAAFTAHILELSSRNVTTVVEGYKQNASLTWQGSADGLGGTYEGISNITKLFGLLLPHFLDLSFTNLIDNATGASVNASFNISGHFPASFSNCGSVGNFTGTVRADASFVDQGGRWIIASETWDFLYPFSSGICS